MKIGQVSVARTSVEDEVNKTCHLLNVAYLLIWFSFFSNFSSNEKNCCCKDTKSCTTCIRHRHEKMKAPPLGSTSVCACERESKRICLMQCPCEEHSPFFHSFPWTKSKISLILAKKKRARLEQQPQSRSYGKTESCSLASIPNYMLFIVEINFQKRMKIIHCCPTIVDCHICHHHLYKFIRNNNKINPPLSRDFIDDSKIKNMKLIYSYSPNMMFGPGSLISPVLTLEPITGLVLLGTA